MKAFIIFRDRVTYARACFGALVKAGLDVHVIDHDSTWPAALIWLDELEASGIPVLRRGENAYPWTIWRWDRFQEVMWGDDEPYVVTDPDVVPSDDCPADWPQRLCSLLGPKRYKAGLGLRLDRLPENPSYGTADSIRERESVFWEHPCEQGVFFANVDTTLAAYRPYTEVPFFSLGPSVRTGPPYVADHVAWYETHPRSVELEYYYAHGDSGQNVARSLRD